MAANIIEQGAFLDEHPSSAYVHIDMPILVSKEKKENSTPDETHTFPASLPDWSNLDVLHRNTLTPRASFSVYGNESDAYTRDVLKSKTLCLSGEWKFHLSKSPFDTPLDFYSSKFDPASWGTITVPGMWQLQGYGKGPQYTNVNYPFPCDPPRVPYDQNETGCYLTTFEVPKSFKDHQLRLRFEGVDSAFHVWVNGKEIGYSQGSRNPSEFDVTESVHSGEENVLAVRVYQYCDGSYIEDQDQWWLSGIFRDVNLLAFPKAHIQDFKVDTYLDTKYEDATLSVHVELNGNDHVRCKLLDASGDIIINETKSVEKSYTFKIFLKNPDKWTAETPYLYQLLLSTTASCVEQRVGFRNSELKRGVFMVNGKPVILRGVNRHEHHPDFGRAVPYDCLRHDLLLMKTHNINAIRTSHYVNDIRLYDLADELGFWVLDECDLECHGFGEVGGNPADWVSDNPAWEKAYVDRARQAVVRDKNHPCVIMWSLGNEAFYGRNHQAMYDFIHKYDPTRLIHYEGDYNAQTADIFSKMYTSCEEIINFAKQSETWEKPLVMCEYVHAMGNGPGGVKEYIEAFYKYPRLMGGFVWEWANHGLRTKNAEGEEYYGYGGDFGDDPNDGNFVIDGLLFSDHTPTPGLLEYKKCIEPVQVVGFKDQKVNIISRYDHNTLDHLKCEYSIVGHNFKFPWKEVPIPKGIQPGETATLKLKDFKYPVTEDYVEVRFTLRSDTNWAKAGHEVAFGQIQLVPAGPLKIPESISSSFGPLYTVTSPQILEIGTLDRSIQWQFNIAKGKLISWKKSDSELIHTPPVLDFFRAETDNDRPTRFGTSWYNSRLHQTQCHVQSVKWEKCKETGNVVVVVQARIAPPVLEWSIDTTLTYMFSDRHLLIKVAGKPRGMNLPNSFARIGLTLSLNDTNTAEWFGRGPAESYRDKKQSQRFGTYKKSIDELFTDYEFPQETGNRTDIRWVEFAGDDKQSLKANFGDLEGASFTALHYTTKDLDECKHPYELYKRKREETVVRLDWAHHGLGTGSCGSATLPEYELHCEDFEYEVLLE